MESISRNLPMDPSGILTREFPYLASRAKSPTDVLDLVGYPQFTTGTTTYSPPISSVLHRSSQQTDETSVTSQQPSNKPIRPTVGPRRASFHSFSYDQGIGQGRKRSVSTPPPLMMPKPVNAIPPTQHTVLQSTSKDKTQVASSSSSAEESGAFNVAPSCTEQELESIYQQLKQYQQEQQAWLKRDKERRQREDWMYAKLCEIQYQLQQLSTRVAGNSDYQPPTYSPCRPRQSSIRLENNDESDLEHETCYLSDEEYEASSGYASEEEEEESEPEDDEEDTTRRHHYYYYYRQHPATAAAAAYQHHRPRPWSSTMMAHPYYHHPQQYHHYAYARGSWPVRRRKSSDTSIRSVPNLVRRSSSSASRFQGPPPPFVFPHDERMIRNRRAPINMM